MALAGCQSGASVAGAMLGCLRLYVALLVALAGLAAPAVAQERKPGPIGEASGPYREQEWFIQWERNTTKWLAQARVFRPPGEGRHPLVLIAHGSPRSEHDRPTMQPGWAETQARWFAAQGFVVVVPMRRGYGRSDGPRQEGSGGCANPDYHNAALTTANDIEGVLRHMAGEPYVDATRMVVVGQSVGGMGALAVASRNPPGVIAVINFAGGSGSEATGSVCAADKLIQTVGQFGTTARIPSLWVYTVNDTFFGPELSRQMADAYLAGGAPAEYQLQRAFGTDGHALFHTPSGIGVWGPLVADFLRRLKLMS